MLRQNGNKPFPFSTGDSEIYYNKTNLDIEKFRGRVLVACERARKMDEKPADRWPQKIGTHVYRLIDEIRDFCPFDED